MRKLLFTVYYEHGKYDYFDDYTHTSFNSRNLVTFPAIPWRYQGGKVEYLLRPTLDFWTTDIIGAQKAYQDYIAKLVLEEP